jgi:cobalt-zinc-cadmium efflux system outer membrane protein
VARCSEASCCGAAPGRPAVDAIPATGGRGALRLALALPLLTACACAAPLTVSGAIALALAQNPELVALRQGRVVAEAKVSAVASTVLASPEIRYSLSDVATDLNAYERNRGNVGLRWSPPRPGALRSASSLAYAKVRETSFDIAAAEQRLAAEVRVLHRTVSLLDEQVRLARDAVRVRERIVAAVSEQVTAGVKNQLDRASAELALAEARALPERLQIERRVEAVKLAHKLGMDAASPLEIASEGDPFGFATPAYDRHKLLARALENRGELGAADARCAAANLTLASERRERYPWISYVQLNRRFEHGDDPASWGFQIGVDLPVFRWKASASQAAAAELEACRLRRQAVRAAIVAEVDEVLARLQAVSAELAGSLATLAGASSGQVEAARVQLAAGQSDLVEPLLAEVKHLSLRQDFIGRLMEFRALEVGLDQAVGDAVR